MGAQPSARTFLSVMQTFVMQLVKFTHTPNENGMPKSVGFHVVKDGLYRFLQDQSVDRKRGPY